MHERYNNLIINWFMHRVWPNSTH